MLGQAIYFRNILLTSRQYSTNQKKKNFCHLLEHGICAQCKGLASSTGQGRPIAKASKLVTCLGGAALEGYLKREVTFYGHDTEKTILLWLVSPNGLNMSFVLQR